VLITKRFEMLDQMAADEAAGAGYYD